MTTEQEIYDVSKIEFGVLSGKEIKKLAVVQIDSNSLTGPGSVYDERMGVLLDSNESCQTCGLKKECWGHFGYIDLVEPVIHPMYFKMVANFLKCFCKLCYRLLITEDCLAISKLLKGKGEKKFTKILAKMDKIDICPHCSASQAKVVFNKSKDKNKELKIMLEHKEKKNGKEKSGITLEVEDIKKIFDRIEPKDIELLGFDPDKIQPKNLIITVLPVIPPCSRPYMVSDGNIGNDDLTTQLIEIVKLNNTLMKNDLSNDKRQKTINTLRFRITTMMDNSKGRAKHPTDNRALKGLKERLDKKKGRLRDNLMGKRVNYSSRTVIGADPTLKLNQVGIPIEICKILTKPETVTYYNIDKLTQMVNNGQANYITKIWRKKDENGKEFGPEIRSRPNLQYAMYKKGTELNYGDIIVRNFEDKKIREFTNNLIPKLTETKIEDLKFPENLKNNFIIVKTGKEEIKNNDKIIRDNKIIDAIPTIKRDISLKIGDIVDVHLQEGDIISYNRQPTLHRGSMLAMEVVPMNCKSFKFNLAATKSFNADFDGDEMNVHAIQSYEAETELRMIMKTSQNIITAQESKPIITITQDSLIAAYLMTKKDFKLTRSQFSDISMKAHLPNGDSVYNPDRIKLIEKILKQNNKNSYVFNGRGLISLILPPNLNYQKKNNAHPDEPIVIIKQGVFISGAFDKNTLGSAHGSLIQILNKEYGSSICSNFIDNMQFIGNAWLLVHGFSIGLEDCMITNKDSIMIIKDTLAQCYTKAQGIEETTRNLGIREIRVTAALSQAKDIGMRIAKEAMKIDNNFLTTVISGAKGDFFNIAQITGPLGQQNLEGKRVTPSLSHGKRTLPHYPFSKLEKEQEYESRGFIRNSFIHGLTPQEFFFHCMSGREGVSDTALSTAKSGYNQRKIVKVCEDIKINYDGTVRDVSNNIYQFSYGSNGYDPVKTIRINDQPSTCDISRLVDRLNTTFEMGINDDFFDGDDLQDVSVSIHYEKQNNDADFVNNDSEDDFDDEGEEGEEEIIEDDEENIIDENIDDDEKNNETEKIDDDDQDIDIDDEIDDDSIDDDDDE